MSVELLAIVLLAVWSVASGVFGLISIRRIRGEVYEVGNSFIDGIEEIITNPTVKGAMTVLGQKGGAAKAENILIDQMATDMLDSPQMAAIRMGASTLGFDLDGYIEQHGAVKTLGAATQLGKMLGIDLMNIDLGSILKGTQQGGSSGSIYGQNGR